MRIPIKLRQIKVVFLAFKIIDKYKKFSAPQIPSPPQSQEPSRLLFTINLFIELPFVKVLLKSIFFHRPPNLQIAVVPEDEMAFMSLNHVNQIGCNYSIKHFFLSIHFYRLCSGGQTFNQTCPDGLVFNPNGAKCDFPANCGKSGDENAIPK